MTVSDAPAGDLVSIRRARPEDANAIAELAAQLGYDATEAEVRERLSAIQHRGSQVVFAACMGVEVIAWIDVAITVHLQSEPFALIGGLVVNEAYRRMHIGRRLCQAAEEWARRQGVTLIRVTSRSTREDAHRFYLRDGYSDVKTSRVFEKRLYRGIADADLQSGADRMEPC